MPSRYRDRLSYLSALFTLRRELNRMTATSSAATMDCDEKVKAAVG
jgi:hypothetical protein